MWCSRSWIDPRVAAAASLVALLLARPAVAEDAPTLFVHLTNASWSGCETIDPSSMGCSDIDVEGNSGGYQFAFVMTGGIGAISGAQFGVEYEGTVDVEGWTLCTGGMSIPEEDWPGSGKALAVTWPETEYPAGLDSLITIGYFSVAAGSTGKLSVAADDRIGRAEYADASGSLYAFESTALGRVDVNGGGQGINACGQAGGSGDSGGGTGGTGDDGDSDDGGTDGDDDASDDLPPALEWEQGAVLARLIGSFDVPPRDYAEGLGIDGFDDLSRALGVVRVRRMIRLSDEIAERFPSIGRIVRIEFDRDIDEAAVARESESLPEVDLAQPNFLYQTTLLSPDPTFSKQWPVNPTATSCLTAPDDPCCSRCDIGVSTAWSLTRGSPAIKVAFFDAGVDMQNLDLTEAFLLNSIEDDGDGIVELCPVSQGGDIGDVPGGIDCPGGPDDPCDDDNNGISDDVQFGFNIEPYGTDPEWYHTPNDHGTAVAGIIAGAGLNGRGTIGVAGGNAETSSPGTKLIPFSYDASSAPGFPTETLIESMTYAAAAEARIYTTSAQFNNALDPLVFDTISALQESLLFLAAAGNRGSTPIASYFGQHPGVLAVGGYDCSGGRWTIPSGAYPPGFAGSDYGDHLALLGPAGDNGTAAYNRWAFDALDKLSSSYACTPPTGDATKCFGGTSAAAPYVAGVAALVLAYEATHEMNPRLTIGNLKRILTRTAEDVLCDSLDVE
jgi:subtilisin family serine protease